MDKSVQEVKPQEAQPQNNQNNIVKTNSKFPTLIVTLLIVIILLLLFLLLYLFFAVNKTKHHNNITTKQSVSIQKPKANTPTSKTTINPYSGWKTYTNSTYGYSFKYPANWIINTSTPYATASPNTSTVTLSNNGNIITFTYDITGIGGVDKLASLIQQIIVSNKNYDLFFQSSSSCPEVGSPGSANAYPTPSCTSSVQNIFLNNISEVQTSNGNSFGSSFMTINGKGSFIGLHLSAPISTSTINTNPYVQVFKKFLLSTTLP
ncbi:hypothetical protein M1145_03570 [Patescibacteria group bacterium]|nr:hypothetical protein [Patescibacteria group bacterium]